MGGVNSDASIAGKPDPSFNAENANIKEKNGNLGEVRRPAIKELRYPKELIESHGSLLVVFFNRLGEEAT